MSADAYSAQLNVRKREGGPNSRNIQWSSLFLLYQYCEVLNGSGKRNIVPLQAFRELYAGTLCVDVPSLTTV